MSSGDPNLCQSDVGIYDGPTTTDIGSECYNQFEGRINRNGIAWVVLHEASSQKHIMNYQEFPIFR